MQYAPTCTDQKSDSYLLDESETWQVFGCMSLRLTRPRRVTLKICTRACKTRRELDEYGHIYEKPAGNWVDVSDTTQTPASHS